MLTCSHQRLHLHPQELALDAVNTVAVAPAGGGQPEIDIKKYIKVEKIPGGSTEDCRVLKGVMFNKVFGLCKQIDHIRDQNADMNDQNTDIRSAPRRITPDGSVEDCRMPKGVMFNKVLRLCVEILKSHS